MWPRPLLNPLTNATINALSHARREQPGEKSTPADIVGYTTLARSLEPEAVMAMLHSLFSRYDDMLGPLNVYKVETIGDACG